MSAGVLDITIEQGATFSLNATLTEDGIIPVDLTGYSGRGSVKKKATDTVVLATFTVTVLPPQTEGVVHIEIPADMTASIVTTGASYKDRLQAVYDIELFNNADDVIRFLNGKALISPEVTK
jgi:hypothetical protein